MSRRFHRQHVHHRDYKRDAVSVFHQKSQSARSVFDTKRRSDSKQPKRHRSDDIRHKSRNTEKNNELSQKEELMSRRKNEKIAVDRNNFKSTKCFQSVFDTKRRSDSKQPKRHRSDDIRHKARNTEKNNELSQKEELMSRRKHEKIAVDRNNFKNSRSLPKLLMEEIKDMLRIEDHHVIYFEDISVVEWCPKFIKPEIRGHVRGGKDLLHHRCRDCRRLCLHLLGRPGTKRQCLECSRNWDKKYIPVWYYHNGCKYC